MRISKKLIMKVADRMISEKGKISQIEIHEEIEKVLGRFLTVSEKKRITMILRNEYNITDVKRDSERGNMRIYYFL